MTFNLNGHAVVITVKVGAGRVIVRDTVTGAVLNVLLSDLR